MSNSRILRSVRFSALLTLMALFSVTVAQAQYCASNATSTADSKIDSVRLVGNSVTLSSNSIAGCATYTNFTALPAADLTPGSNYSVIVRLGTCGGNFTKYARVYIDYNQDFDFLDAGENVGTIGPIVAPAIGTVNFTVPGGALPGNTRMRIVCIESNANPPSCGTYTWGETEDYTVQIASASPINGGASNIALPASACGLSATTPISFTMNNVGTNPIGPFQVGYIINGGAPVLENFAGTLAPLTNQVFNFATTANLSAAGAYTIKCFVVVPGDGFVGNDTVTGVTNNLPVINTFPNFQDFETGQGGWASSGTNSTWAFGTPNGGGLVGAASGVNAWVTNLTGVYNNNEKSFVTSPCIDFSQPGLPFIQFSAYWNSETGWDGAQLQASIDGGTTWSTVGQFNDPIVPPAVNWYNAANFNGIFGLNGATNQNGWGGSGAASSGTWVTASRFLPTLAGQSNVRLRFAFGSDGSVQVGTGFAFDNVLINVTPPYDDLKADSVTSVANACGLGPANPINLYIRNTGVQNIPAGTTFPVGYSINGGAPVIENITLAAALNTTGTLNYTFTTQANFSVVGAYNIKAWVSLPSDTIETNDTTSTVVNNLMVINVFPNYQDFETGQNGWASSGTNNTWGFGTPNFGGLTTAASGVNAWVTNLTGFYANNEKSFVTSPCIDFSGPGLPHIEASIYWNSESGWDGAQLQASTNGGVTWVTVGQFNDPVLPAPVNWYNAANFNGIFGLNGATNQNGWGGSGTASSGTWVTMSRVLPTLAGQANVRLRFAFGSDGSVQQGTGFAFDNVRLNLLPPYDDVDATVATVPQGGCNLGMSTISMTMANTGVQTFPAGASFPVGYSLNGGTPVIETITLTAAVAPGATFNYTFTTMADFSAVGDYDILMWADMASDTIPSNDTVSAFVSHKPLVNVFPHFESFETSTGGWEAGGTNSTWVLGTPNKPGSIQGAAHGTQAWVNGGLTGQYLGQDQSYVEGPCYDLSVVPATHKVALSYWRDSEQGWDGANLQYSVDGGASWNLLGNVGTGTNWYNGTINAAPPGGFTQAWNGAGTAYVRAEHPLPAALIGAFNVRFRVAFGSDFSVQDAGFAFDAFAIGEPTPFTLGPDTTVCGDYTINTNLPGGGMSDFGWSTGDSTNSIFMVNTGGTSTTQTVILAYTNPEGFVSRDTAIVTILPGPDQVYFGDTISFCEGTTLELQADTSLLGSTVFTYNWSTGSTTYNTFVTSTQMVTGVATFPGGCTANDTVYAIRNDSLDLDLGPDQVLCGQTATTLDATQGGNNFYAWNNGANMPVIPVTFTGTYTVQVSNECFSQLESVHITLVPNAPIISIGPDTTVCVGTPYMLGLTGTIPNPNSILWSTGGTGNTITANAAGEYSVTVTDTFGCSDADTMQVSHIQLPIAGLSIDDSNCPTIAFTNNSAGATDVLWNLGNGATSTQSNFTHTYLSGGVYTVTLEANNACGTNAVSQTVTINCITGVGDESLLGQLVLYPNPSDGLFSLSFGDIAGEAKLVVSNLAGQIVAQQVLNVNGNAQTQALDLRHLSQGVYSLNVRTPQGEATFRLVIQR